MYFGRLVDYSIRQATRLRNRLKNKNTDRIRKAALQSDSAPEADRYALE